MLFHSIEFIFGFLPLTFLAFVLVHTIWGRQLTEERYELRLNPK